MNWQKEGMKQIANDGIRWRAVWNKVLAHNEHYHGCDMAMIL